MECRCGGLGCRQAALLGQTGAVPRAEVGGRPGPSVAGAGQVLGLSAVGGAVLKGTLVCRTKWCSDFGGAFLMENLHVFTYL